MLTEIYGQSSTSNLLREHESVLMLKGQVRLIPGSRVSRRVRQLSMECLGTLDRRRIVCVDRSRLRSAVRDQWPQPDQQRCKLFQVLKPAARPRLIKGGLLAWSSAFGAVRDPDSLSSLDRRRAPPTRSPGGPARKEELWKPLPFELRSSLRSLALRGSSAPLHRPPWSPGVR